MKSSGYNSSKSWRVVAACSFIFCMIGLPVRATSMLFVEFVDRYNTDRKNATLSFIIYGLLKCVAGPFTGYLGQIIALKYITTMGCCFASLGVAVCFFAESILTVNLSLGLIFGTGYCLASTLIPQILKQHFNKDIANANGFVNAGAHMLQFAFIPLFAYFINMYGISGALLITSGIMLHCIPIAMLLNDPKYNELPLTFPANVHRENCIDNMCEHISECDYIDGNLSRTNGDISNKHDLLATESREYKVTNGPAQIFTVCKTMECNKQSGESHQQSKTVLSQSCSTDNLENKTIACPETINEVESPISGRLNRLKHSLKAFQVFTDPSFLMIMVCESIRVYVDVFIVTAIIDISRDKGIAQSQEKYFPMGFLVAETAGNTCLGWVTDKGYLKVPNYMAVCFLCMGVSSCSFVFSNSFPTMLTVAMIFGMACSGIAIVIPVLIYDCVEKSKHNMAIASRIILYAPLSFTIAPLIGYFRDTLGSYNGALYLVTAINVVSCVLVYLIPRISRRKK